jgi:hypothetical protein
MGSRPRRRLVTTRLSQPKKRGPGLIVVLGFTAVWAATVIGTIALMKDGAPIVGALAVGQLFSVLAALDQLAR